jgi:hypothetical protein
MAPFYPFRGPSGGQRTKVRVGERYYWYGMSQDIALFVARCSACNQNKKNTRTRRCHMTEYHAGAPMEKVHIDFLGPLPKTLRSNEYILMIVDQFTKWVECIPVPNHTVSFEIL